MRLAREEIEAAAWKMVRQGRAPSERSLQDWISQQVHERLNANQPPAGVPGIRTYHRTDTGPGHQQVVRDVLWSLVQARIIRPGEQGHGQLSWNETALLSASTPSSRPVDPAFLSGLKTTGLSAPVFFYVRHSVLALSACPTAAMSMLGNANELLVDELISAFAASSHAAPDLGSKLNKKWQISQRFKLFRAEFDPKAKQILRDAGASDGSDTFITGVFDHIRLDRNEAGHPSGRQFEHDEVEANLMLFGVQARRCASLISYLEQHKR